MSESDSSEIGQPSGLLFVYNADGGVVERTLDYLHKLTSPATYSCSLCALTYGALRGGSSSSASPIESTSCTVTSSSASTASSRTYRCRRCSRLCPARCLAWW